ncbi:CBO0543 family protein [Salipaludibacillus neizhouensis]|uniref:CBO0543 family protein n=1 Tax=Salipaludibacillus neizhouensis TaxID=885475 RepID=UPI0028777239|nr:CBO0543 family protein [Salipaludibacillus neizhouensis]
MVSTLIDGPIIKTKYVQYPKRYFPNLFDSNIVFLYILFPLSCVIYNQFTYKMKPIKTFFSVFLFSVPMALLENILEKYTKLVEFRKGWNGYYTVAVLSATFWFVRLFIAGIRFKDKKRKPADTPKKEFNKVDFY